MHYSDRYMAYMGMAPRRIPHWEHWSCIGNHIPWNVPPPAIKRYLNLSAELAHR